MSAYGVGVTFVFVPKITFNLRYMVIFFFNILNYLILELTELFLKKNADLTKCTTHGDTALHGACGSIKSHVDVVNMLVKAGL